MKISLTHLRRERGQRYIWNRYSGLPQHSVCSGCGCGKKLPDVDGRIYLAVADSQLGGHPVWGTKNFSP